MDDQNMNPYGQPQGDDPFAQNPYSQPQGGDPYGQQQTDPYAQQQADPYAQQQANPYAQQQGGNPYGQQQSNPYAQQQGGNPYGQQQANPYAQQQGGNPYGQQQASPYAQQQGGNPYGQQGVNPYGAGGAAPVPPKAPKKKMSGKMKALIFGGIGAVVLAVGLYFLFTKVIFPPKKTVRTAFDNSFTVERVTEGSVLMNELGLGELSNAFAKDGGSVAMKATVKKMDGTSSVEGLNVDVNAVVDKQKKQMSGEAVLTNKKGKNITAEVFGDEEQTYFTVKDLFDGYAAVNNKNILTSLKNSPLLKDTDLSALEAMPDISIDLFSEESFADNFKLSDDFWEEVSVSSAGKETLTIDGESVSAKRYDVTIPKEKIQEKVEELVEQYIAKFAGSQYADFLSKYGVSGSDLNSMLPQIKSLVKGMIKDDVVVNVYLYDDKVVSIKLSGEIQIVAYTMNYNIDLITYLSDSKSVISLDASVSLMGQKIGANASIISKKEGSTITTDVDASISAAGREALSLNYKQTYDTASKVISGTGTVSVPNRDSVLINVHGAVTELEKGKVLTVKLDDINLSYGTRDVGFGLEMTLKSIDGASVKTRDNSRKVVNLMTCTKEEAESLVSKEKLDQFSKELSEFFGH